MNPDDVFGKITPPGPASSYTSGTGAQGLSAFITNVISLIYMVAGLVFVFMIIIAGFQWLTSGGEKEKVADARKRLTWAIIGIVVLALTFALLNVLGQLLNFSFFHR